MAPRAFKQAAVVADSRRMLRRLLGFGQAHRSVPLRTLRRFANASWRDAAMHW
jgi:hypothetical protein